MCLCGGDHCRLFSKPKESAKFEDKGVKASATRARKALGELGKLSKERRKEIQDKKNAM